MNEVWLVEGTQAVTDSEETLRYCERWPVCVYPDEETAILHARLANEWSRVNWMNGSWRDSGNAVHHPFDENGAALRSRYAYPLYFVRKVVFARHPDEYQDIMEATRREKT